MSYVGSYLGEGDTITVYVSAAPGTITPVPSAYTAAAPAYRDLVASALDRLCEYSRSGVTTTAITFLASLP